MTITCAHCGHPCDKPTGAVNRARKMGLNQYCNKECAGKGRRIPPRSKEDLKDAKWWYDAFRRRALAAEIKIKKALAFKKDYAANPKKYKADRIRKKEAHAAYVQSPRYRKWKSKYDQKHRAYKKYGEFAEAAIIINKIEKLVDKKQSRFDRNCHNKTQTRKRLWKSSQRLT